MSYIYILIEPIFPEILSDFIFPVGQAGPCLKALNEVSSKEEMFEALRTEYLSIVTALQEMNIDFRIFHTGRREIDQETLRLSLKNGAILKDFFEFNQYMTDIYPRDFLTILNPTTILLNPYYSYPTADHLSGWNIFSSHLGEGGRILHVDDVALVPSLLNTDDENEMKPSFTELTASGLTVSTISQSVSVKITSQREIHSLSLITNDHLDRVACLVRGRDHALHLIVDPLVQTTIWHCGSEGLMWEPKNNRDSINEIKRVCDSLKITLHCPQQLIVPYALNLEQFADGRVLMTSGDKIVEGIVREIVGEENVFTTSIPIKFYPCLLRAGIRCMINRFPSFIL